MVKLEELERELEKFDRQQRLQKDLGCKFQVTAEPLLEEMGYKIIRAYHRPFTSLGKRRRGWTWYIEKLGDYLWNYADYVATKDGLLYVVDVKSQGYVPLLKGEDGDPLTPSTISFSEMERREYSASKVPVLVLLMLYNWGGKVKELPLGRMGIKNIVEYSEKPDARRLGPLFYKLVPFSDFQFRQDVAGGILANKFQGCKKLSSRDVYDLLRKTAALDIVRIEPGCLWREKNGRIVAEGLPPS